MYLYANKISAEDFFYMLAHSDYTSLEPVLRKGHTIAQAWQILEDENLKLNGGANNDRVLDLAKMIEILKAKHKSIELCVMYLRNRFDTDLIELLKTYGYSFKYEYKTIQNESFSGGVPVFQKNLDKIINDSKGILTKITAAEKRLPKPKKSDSKLSFEETVFSYAAFTGLGYIKTSQIVLTEYYALINLGNEKIKSLKNGTEKSNHGR